MSYRGSRSSHRKCEQREQARAEERRREAPQARRAHLPPHPHSGRGPCDQRGDDQINAKRHRTIRNVRLLVPATMVKAIEKLACLEVDALDHESFLSCVIRKPAWDREVLTRDHNRAIGPWPLHAERALEMNIGQNLLRDLTRRDVRGANKRITLFTLLDERLRA